MVTREGGVIRQRSITLAFLAITCLGIMIYLLPVMLSPHLHPADSMTHYAIQQEIISQNSLPRNVPEYLGSSTLDYPLGFHILISSTTLLVGIDLLIVAKFIPTFIGLLVSLFVFVAAHSIFRNAKISLFSYLASILSPILMQQFANFNKPQQLSLVLFLGILIILISKTNAFSKVVLISLLIVALFQVNVRCAITLLGSLLVLSIPAFLFTYPRKTDFMCLLVAYSIGFFLSFLLWPVTLNRYLGSLTLSTIGSPEEVRVYFTFLLVISVGLAAFLLKSNRVRLQKSALSEYNFPKKSMRFWKTHLQNKSIILCFVGFLIIIAFVYFDATHGTEISRFEKGANYEPIFDYILYIGPAAFFFGYAISTHNIMKKGIFLLLSISIFIFLVSKPTWVEYFLVRILGDSFEGYSYRFANPIRYINMLAPFIAIFSGMGIYSIQKRIKCGQLASSLTAASIGLVAVAYFSHPPLQSKMSIDISSVNGFLIFGIFSLAILLSLLFVSSSQKLRNKFFKQSAVIVAALLVISSVPIVYTEILVYTQPDKIVVSIDDKYVDYLQWIKYEVPDDSVLVNFANNYQGNVLGTNTHKKVFIEYRADQGRANLVFILFVNPSDKRTLYNIASEGAIYVCLDAGAFDHFSRVYHQSSVSSVHTAFSSSSHLYILYKNNDLNEVLVII